MNRRSPLSRSLPRFRRRPLSWAFTKEDFARDPDLRPDLASLQQNVDMLKDLGLIKQSVDVKAHSDLSMLEEAVARLKVKVNGAGGPSPHFKDDRC